MTTSVASAPVAVSKCIIKGVRNRRKNRNSRLKAFTHQKITNKEERKMTQN